MPRSCRARWNPNRVRRTPASAISRKRAGAVSGVTHVKNPISAARAVMEMPGGRHVMLVGEGAERYVLGEAVAEAVSASRTSATSTSGPAGGCRTSANAFARPSERRQRNADSGGRADLRFGTVGAVALDAAGNLAAGTSTGGVNDKWTGRVGDCPILGAGTYADNRACGVSCSGTGELFIRHCVAHDVVARMVYAKAESAEAAQAAIDQLPDEPGGVGGLIALDHDGPRHVRRIAENRWHVSRLRHRSRRHLRRDLCEG